MGMRACVTNLVALSLICAGGCSSDNPAMTVATGGFVAGTGGFGSTGGATLGTGGSTLTGGSLLPGTGGTSTVTGGAGAVTGGASTGTGGDAGVAGSDASVTGGNVSTTGGMDMGTGGSNAQALPPVTDYAAPGPFSTTMEANVGPNNNYTIFRPDPLGENGFLHSPIIFGPGIATTPSMYANFLDHLASHGFVSIVVNSLSGSPGDQANVDAMKTGLDWILAQNDMAGTYQGMLAVDRAIGMGYSLGATASVQLSSHAAIMTTVAIHGHNTSGDPHGPVLLLTGTNDVINDVRATLSTLEEAPAIMMALPIGHLDVLTELAMTVAISSSTRYVAPITAWLRYWVNGDDDAKHFFWGASCDMCSTPWSTPETNALWDAQSL